jgi:hypothetical protein
MWWVRRVGNHGDAVLGKEFPDPQGRVAWRIVVVQKPGTGRPFPTNCISKAFAERLCRQSDSCSGVGEETRDAPDPPRQKEKAIVDGRAAIFKPGIPLRCLGPTQRCFFECLLLHFVRLCGRLTKFLAELDANTLLLQHIHFTIRRDNQDCTVDKLAHDWVKLPFAPLVCGVRGCC